MWPVLQNFNINKKKFLKFWNFFFVFVCTYIQYMAQTFNGWMRPHPFGRLQLWANQTHSETENLWHMRYGRLSLNRLLTKILHPACRIFWVTSSDTQLAMNSQGSGIYREVAIMRKKCSTSSWKCDLQNDKFTFIEIDTRRKIFCLRRLKLHQYLQFSTLQP